MSEGYFTQCAVGFQEEDCTFKFQLWLLWNFPIVDYNERFGFPLGKLHLNQELIYVAPIRIILRFI